MRRENGFSLVELLIVVAIIGLMGLFGYNALQGVRERNAITTVSQEVKHLLERYRQKAVDKGINYGIIFSDDGMYVFEDNGGNATDPYAGMNNFAIDAGEYSDQYRGDGSDEVRQLRRVSDVQGEFYFLREESTAGQFLVMTTSSADFSSARSGSPASADGTDITSQAAPGFSGGSSAPFDSNTLALFFSPDGMVYLKDPTVTATSVSKNQYRLGNGGDLFYVVRIAFDDTSTGRAELPNYYEIYVNRYGATTKVRWNSLDGGSSWNAQIE